MKYVLFLLMLASTVSLADPVATGPSLKMPDRITASPGAPFRLSLDTNCKRVRWTYGSIVRINPEWVKEADKNFVGIAPAVNGEYKIDVLGSLNDEWVEGSTIVVVGPPGPEPPGPKPPTPPAPPTPTPVDPLLKELQAAYSTTFEKDRNTHRIVLQNLYSFSAGAALNDKDVTSTGQFFAIIKGIADKNLPPDALKSVRELIAKEHAKVFPAEDAPLTDELRKKASAHVTRIANLLGALK